MANYILGMYKPIVTFIFALIMADFLIFMRQWSMDVIPVKGIIKFILKLDVYFILSAILLLILANLPGIISIFL